MVCVCTDRVVRNDRGILFGHNTRSYDVGTIGFAPLSSGSFLVLLDSSHTFREPFVFCVFHVSTWEDS